MSGNKVTIDPKLTTVSERLTEIGDSIGLAFYDNGFMMEVGGVDSRIEGEEQFRSVKLIGHKRRRQ
jgi:hypothetical protein